MESKEQLGTNGSFATSCFSIIVNFDPAAEHFDYPMALDIRELVNLDDVMEEVGLGPNGGLMYCMEHLEDNLDDWLAEGLEDYLDDDYLVFDCPGGQLAQ